LTRPLKYINILIAVVVLAVFVAVYWYAVRPLPQTSGRVAAPVSNAAIAARDPLGVPHIKAASEEDALFVQGYVTAQDRLWHMDLLRRIANGELAEIFGPAALDSDQDSRRLRIRRLAEDAVTSMTPADRAIFAAYVRGVNHFIDTHLDRLPVEFTLLGYDPRPWRTADSLAIGLSMYRTLTTSWRAEIEKRAWLAAGDPNKVNALFPVRSGAETPPGSNAWAVAGALTASGRPILAGDMHLEATIPSIWYLAHLEAPGLNVSGVSLPGVPGIIAGHNERIAWSTTNLGFDVQDLHSIRIDERTGQYVYAGKLDQARPEQEVIRVRGERPVELVVWVTRYGPLFLSEGNERFALRWIAAEPGGYQFPFLEINRAQDWNQFVKALARFAGPAQNFVYADSAGNIGYHVAGKLPVRKGYLGDVPASGDQGWAGDIPFEQLPHSLNPAAGMIVSANQYPFPEDYPYAANGSFAPPYRANQIRSLLQKKKGWSAADMLAVQMDVYSAFSHYLARAVVLAYDRRKPSNPRLPSAIDLLRKWNGQMDKELPAPFLVTLVFQHLRRTIAESAARKKGASYDNWMSTAVIERLLRDQPPGWVSGWDQALIRALDEAVEEGSRIQGREPSRWKWGEYLVMRVGHPIGSRLPWYISRPLTFWWLLTPWRDYDNYSFGAGPVPMSGSSTTVKQTTRRVMPSMRIIVDLGDLERSLANIPMGQSGQILSPHYKDQWDSHYNGTSFSMRFRRVEAADTLEFEPAR
jgi:penicillin amidase